MTQYNYYKAAFTVVTASRARRMGVRTSRSYGYYVLIDPPVTAGGKNPGAERVQCWCKTKDIAEEEAERCRESQRKGYYGCPCGSGAQARLCCGLLAVKAELAKQQQGTIP